MAFFLTGRLKRKVWTAPSVVTAMSVMVQLTEELRA
jgi:hypothetical protein